jgi:hypothetical protein
MACDICNKKGVYLDDLHDWYQTDDIKQVCGDCTKDLNRQISKIKVMNQGFLERLIKRYMANKKQGDASYD